MTKFCRSCTSVSVIDFEWVSNANKTVKWYAVFDHAWRAWQQMTYLSELQIDHNYWVSICFYCVTIWNSFSHFPYMFQTFGLIRRRFVEFLLDAGPSWRRDRMSHRLVNGLFEFKKRIRIIRKNSILLNPIELYFSIFLNPAIPNSF